MADNDTNVTPAPVEQGKTDGDIEGVDTQSTQTEETPKTFTQAEIDRMIQARLAEQQKSLKTKFEKDLEAKLAATREEAQKDLDKLVEERANARLVEAELAKTRTAIMEEFGLNEDQAARLQGANPEELKKDADKVFGALKQIPRQKPPVIKTGEGGGEGTNGLDISKLSPAEIRANRDKLWSNAKAP